MDELNTADSGFVDQGASLIGADLFGAIEPQSEVSENGESNDDAAEISEAEKAAPEKNLEESEPADNKAEEEKIEKKAEEEATEDKEQEDKTSRPAPSSWKKVMHEDWAKLPEPVQEYIELREKQMKEGIEVSRKDADLGRIMRDVMTPYSRLISQSGADEPTMVKNLLNAHYLLSTSPADQKKQLFKSLAQQYGVQFSGENNEVTTTDPTVQNLRRELNELKSLLNNREKATLQQARSDIESQVSKFALDNEYFDDVAEDMVPLIRNGDTLEEAYKKAIWANPITRQKEIEKIEREKERNRREKAQKEAEAAKKAKSANIKSRDTAKAPTEPLGTMDDTLNEILRNIQNRN